MPRRRASAKPPEPANAASKPPWPSGLKRQRTAIGQQQLVGLGVDGGHGSLAKDGHVVRQRVRNRSFSCQIVDRLVVRGRAGHQIDRDRSAGRPAASERLFEQNLKQRGPGERADREHPLGMGKPEPCSLAAGHDDQADLAGGQSLPRPVAGPWRPSQSARSASRIAAGGSARWAKSAQAWPACPAAVSRSISSEVDLVDLVGQGLPSRARPIACQKVSKCSCPAGLSCASSWSCIRYSCSIKRRQNRFKTSHAPRHKPTGTVAGNNTKITA